MTVLGPLSLVATVGSEVIRRIGEVRLEQERRKTQIVIAVGTITVALIGGIFMGIDKYRASRKHERIASESAKS